MVPEQQESQNIVKNLPMTSDHVFVKATFSIPSRSHVPTTPTVHNHKFDETNCQPMIVGLPEGVIPSKPKAGDTSYSGMHDHGPLVPPKEGGIFAQLLSCIDAAKSESDKLLTQIIEEERSAGIKNGGMQESNTNTDGSPSLLLH